MCPFEFVSSGCWLTTVRLSSADRLAWADDGIALVSRKGREHLDEDDADEGDEGEDVNDEDEEVRVEFNFYDPEPEDAPALVKFLSAFLLQTVDDGSGAAATPKSASGKHAKTFDARALARAVSEQAAVGTVIKQDPSNPPMGFATVLPVKIDGKHPGVAPVLSFIRKHGSEAVNKIIQDDQNTLGLFVQGRYLNLPFELALNLHSCLLEDLAWAAKELKGEEAEAFRFSHVVLVSTRFDKTRRPAQDEDDSDDEQGQDDQADDDEEKQAPGKKRKAAEAKAAAVAAAKKAKLAKQHAAAAAEVDSENFGFVRFEEELLSRYAAAKCLLQNINDQNGRCLEIMVLTMAQFRKAIAKMPEFLMELNADHSDNEEQ